MSLLDPWKKTAQKVMTNHGLAGAAADMTSGGKYSLPNAGTIANQPWANLANSMFNGVKNTANKVGGQNQPQQQPMPADQPQQQGLQAPKQQLPGKNGYTPTTAPYGMDQSNPGVQEQYWNQNQNLWNKGMSSGPGQGEQFWNQVQGNYNKASQDLTPQFNQFYDNARSNAVGEVNKQAAARGAYGSSQALNGVGNAISDIEGQRAKASTDFMFGNAANQNQALNSYGNMAFGAQGMTNNRNAMDLTALNSGYQAAGQAQNQRNNRIQGQFDNTFRQQNSMLGYMGNQYDQLLGQDSNLYGQATGAGPAATAEALSASNNRRQQNYQDASLGLGLYGAFGGGGGGTPGTPATPSTPSYQNPYSVAPSTPW